MIFDLVTLTLQVDLLKKNFLDYDFWIRGVTFCCYLHMVADGELCCLSDNSGFYHVCLLLVILFTVLVIYIWLHFWWKFFFFSLQTCPILLPQLRRSVFYASTMYILTIRYGHSTQSNPSYPLSPISQTEGATLAFPLSFQLNYKIFMPRIEWFGAYCFCPVCLFVCLFVCLLSTLTFAITFEPLEVETSYLACILY